MNLHRGIAIIFFIILLIITGFRYYRIEAPKSSKNVGLIEVRIEELEFKQFEKPDLENRFNLNTMTFEEMVSRGLTERRARGIIEYRDIVGIIKNIDELQAVSGIGEKTVELLKENYMVSDEGIKNISQARVNVNSGNSNRLAMAGFTNAEIRKIERWREENGDLFSNIDLIEVVGNDRYNEVSSRVKFDEF